MSRDSWLFLFAAISALGALAGLLPKVAGWLPAMKPMVWVAIAIALSLILSLVGFIRSLHSVPAYNKNAKLERIEDKEFVNTEVVLDGKRFHRCRFENVTYICKGTAPFELERCTFVGLKTIKCSNAAQFGLLALQKAFKALRDDTRFISSEDWKNIEEAQPYQP